MAHRYDTSNGVDQVVYKLYGLTGEEIKIVEAQGGKKMNNEICEAIKNKRVIEFSYKGHGRVVEPHCYGIHKDTNNEVLCAYQAGGYSSSGEKPPWRLYIISEMSGIVVTDNQFENSRDGYIKNDSRMSKIFCQI